MKDLEYQLTDPDLWKNQKLAEEKSREAGELRDLLKGYRAIDSGLRELEGEFSEEKFHELKRKIAALEIRTKLAGKYDKQAAVVSVYAGAGGEDAADWAKMLLEMYFKYGERRGFKTRFIDDNTVEFKGNCAYGYLKNEAGVHRLVRQSPFSAKKLRHTSFALVEVLPELPEVDENVVKIPEDDLKVEFYRSSGPGGQNVNKVETAVRVIHKPTSLSAASQNERSQSQNREKAVKILKAKLLKLMEENKKKELGELRTKIKPEWGNQIRSYVLHPYKLVKDHRTGRETGRAEEVLNGDLDAFIEAEI